MHTVKKNKKNGYRQLNVRQFLHILASPGNAPGSIHSTQLNMPHRWLQRERSLKSLTISPIL